MPENNYNISEESSYPPIIERTAKHIKIFQGSKVIADTIRPVTIIEKLHTAVYCFPPENVHKEYFKKNEYKTKCKWKGEAVYYDFIFEDQVIKNCAWSYPNPKSEYSEIEDYIIFNPAKFDAFYVNGELVNFEPGNN